MGEVVVNRRPFEDYFPRDWHREEILKPLVATETCGLFDIQSHAEGGGLSGKAGAIRLGLARALQNYNPEYRPPLKRLGLLTRDPRKVERKKIGLKKARKAPQWVRR
jgi:small subunit ribosomal protein S9